MILASYQNTVFFPFSQLHFETNAKVMCRMHGSWEGAVASAAGREQKPRHIPFFHEKVYPQVARIGVVDMYSSDCSLFSSSSVPATVVPALCSHSFSS